MKAYRDENGKVTMFRPDMNMKRMNNTAARVAMPVRDDASDLRDVRQVTLPSSRRSMARP